MEGKFVEEKTNDKKRRKRNYKSKNKKAAVDKSENEPKKPPNWFFAMQFTNPTILQKMRDVQQHIAQEEPRLAPACVSIAKSHITLFVFHADHEEIEEIARLLNDSVARFKNEWPHVNKLTVDASEIGHFRNEVVFAKLQFQDPTTFMSLWQFLAEQLNHAGYIGHNDTLAHNFKPHLTLLKMSRMKNSKVKVDKEKRMKKIPPELYEQFSQIHFGTQVIESVQLLSMTKPETSNGYYFCHTQVPLGSTLPNPKNPEDIQTLEPPSPSSSSSSSSESKSFGSSCNNQEPSSSSSSFPDFPKLEGSEDQQNPEPSSSSSGSKMLGSTSNVPTTSQDQLSPDCQILKGAITSGPERKTPHEATKHNSESSSSSLSSYHQRSFGSFPKTPEDEHNVQPSSAASQSFESISSLPNHKTTEDEQNPETSQSPDCQILKVAGPERKTHCEAAKHNSESCDSQSFSWPNDKIPEDKQNPEPSKSHTSLPKTKPQEDKLDWDISSSENQNSEPTSTLSKSKVKDYELDPVPSSSESQVLGSTSISTTFSKSKTPDDKQDPPPSSSESKILQSQKRALSAEKIPRAQEEVNGTAKRTKGSEESGTTWLCNRNIIWTSTFALASLIAIKLLLGRVKPT